MARSFNSSTDGIIAPNQGGATPPYSASAWFNMGSGVANFSTILFFDNGVAYSAFVGPNAGFVSYYNDNGTNYANGSHAIFNNTWYHVAFTVDGSNNQIGYLNGASDATLTYTTTLPVQLDIGNSASGSFQPGAIADVAWWNVKLTALEISALAAGVRPPQIRPAALKGYWPLDGLRSPEPDLSGNMNNGTLTGTALAFGPPFTPFTPRWPRFTPFVAPTSILWAQSAM